MRRTLRKRNKLHSRFHSVGYGRKEIRRLRPYISTAPRARTERESARLCFSPFAARTMRTSREIIFSRTSPRTARERRTIRRNLKNGGQNSTRSTATLKPTKPNPGSSPKESPKSKRKQSAKSSSKTIKLKPRGFANFAKSRGLSFVF